MMRAMQQDESRPLPLREAALAALTRIFEDNSFSLEDDDESQDESRNKPIVGKKVLPKKKNASPSKWPRRRRIRETIVVQELSMDDGTTPQPLATTLKRKQAFCKLFEKDSPGTPTPRPFGVPKNPSPRESSGVRRHRKRVTFPHKLFNLLESGMYPDVIGWAKGQKSFCIHDRKGLERVLPEAGFDLSKTRSFHRQLSLWGFSRSKGGLIDPTKGRHNKKWLPEVWKHPGFIQGMHRDGLFNIVRIVGKKTKENESQPTPVTPDPSPVKSVQPGAALATNKKQATVARKKPSTGKATKNTKSSKAIMIPQVKDMIIQDHRPLFPLFFNGDSTLSPLHRRISFQESDLEQDLEMFAIPPDLDRSDSCSSALSFMSIEGDLLCTLPIQEFSEDCFSITDSELVAQV